jgi:UDP-N-acetylmuramoyl-L-alanyl-D-glutamate--2,6-diaminopimelate ligase
MRLSALVRHSVDPDPEITGVTADSRLVRPGWLFVALAGAKADGRRFIGDAVKAGAAAVLTDQAIEGLDVPVVRACDPRRAYALAAAAFWGAQPETCVAVTGTNGKTSVVTFCRQILTRLGRRAASMGTLGVVAGDEQITPPGGLTSLDAADTARLLAELAGRGVTLLALEASSHGIHQRRLDGVRLAAAGFTNLTQDHLDYHGDMDAYRDAKLRLFQAVLPRGATAVLNADSDAFKAFAAAAILAGQTVLSVGEQGQSLRLASREPTAGGQRLTIVENEHSHTVNLPLVGAYQASNALVAAGLCIAVGEDVGPVLAALEHIEGAPGRLQRVGAGPRGGEAFVDYAHTPDGLETVLSALRPHARGRLIVVFGAGGDRDRGKRPIMGEIATRLADLVIITDDNPRTEQASHIRAAILAAAPGAREIGDRREAIAAAASELVEGDILVVAGKGHEQGQLVGETLLPFDDIAEVSAALGLEPAHG